MRGCKAGTLRPVTKQQSYRIRNFRFIAGPYPEKVWLNDITAHEICNGSKPGYKKDPPEPVGFEINKHEHKQEQIQRHPKL